MELATRTIVESRLKAAGFLAMSAGFVALGFWIALYPDHPADAFWGWACVALFGLGAPVFAWQLARPMRLTLDANGFVLAGAPRGFPKSVHWADIDRFFLDRGPRGVKVIRFNYLPARAPTGLMTRIARTIEDRDAGLPTGWTLTPEEVVDLLNEYRFSHGTSAAAPPQPQIFS